MVRVAVRYARAPGVASVAAAPSQPCPLRRRATPRRCATRRASLLKAGRHGAARTPPTNARREVARWQASSPYSWRRTTPPSAAAASKRGANIDIMPRKSCRLYAGEPVIIVEPWARAHATPYARKRRCRCSFARTPQHTFARHY